MSSIDKRRHLKFPIRSRKSYLEALNQAKWVESYKVSKEGVLTQPLSPYEKQLIEEIEKYEAKHNIDQEGRPW